MLKAPRFPESAKTPNLPWIIHPHQLVESSDSMFPSLPPSKRRSPRWELVYVGNATELLVALEKPRFPGEWMVGHKREERKQVLCEVLKLWYLECCVRHVKTMTGSIAKKHAKPRLIDEQIPLGYMYRSMK